MSNPMLYDDYGNEIGLWNDLMGDVPFNMEDAKRLIAEYSGQIDVQRDPDWVNYEDLEPQYPYGPGLTDEAYVSPWSTSKDIKNPYYDVLSGSGLLEKLNIFARLAVNSSVYNVLMGAIDMISRREISSEDISKVADALSMIRDKATNVAVSYGIGTTVFQSDLFKENVEVPIYDNRGNFLGTKMMPKLDYNAAISVNAGFNQIFNRLQTGQYVSGGGTGQFGGINFSEDYWRYSLYGGPGEIGGWMKSKFGDYYLKKN